MQSNTAPKAAHPRRPPAHLSVSLKHGKSPRAAHASAAQNAPVSMPSSSPKRPSNGKGSESGNGAQKWFNNANENSARGVEDSTYQCQSQTPRLLLTLLHRRSSVFPEKIKL